MDLLDFVETLNRLVQNDKNQINALTLFAHTNPSMAVQIVEALETHLRNTLPAYKLPAMYVLDSIIKNVGSPYTSLFAANLVQTFAKVYAAVGEGEKVKLGKLAGTV